MSKAITCPKCHAIFLEDYEPEQLDKLEVIELTLPPNLKELRLVKPGEGRMVELADTQGGQN